MATVHAEAAVGDRAGWRAVAIPTEHGGWGLTMEPVLLGLIVAWSGAGVAVGVAAFAAFLLRTPAKLVAVDIRRDRWLDRSRLAGPHSLIEGSPCSGRHRRAPRAPEPAHLVCDGRCLAACISRQKRSSRLG